MGRKSEKYKFIVDTNSYSGNFEREMMAYATGLCTHRGQEYASGFEDEFPEIFKELDGIVVPCGEYDDVANIEPTPGWWNNGLGGHYRDDDPKAEEKALIARNKEDERYKRQNIERSKQTLQMLLDGKNPWGPNVDIQEQIKGFQREIENFEETLAKSLAQPLNKWPAYQSVAMVFSKKPSDALLETMVKRCREFPTLSMHPSYTAESYNKIEITGFRLVKEEKVVVEKLIQTWA